MELKVKRVHDDASPGDGFRVLVDRLWPRGLTKERAAVGLWAKDAAPSTELRRAFHGGGMSWDEFEAAYRAELAANPAVAELREAVARHPVATLLYGVHDPARNHAVILREALLAP
ncbi:DUF488 family protein, N3 subclade [Microbacterium ulmi]|uniref:DUF488 family protein n=1 Tax=Microbacterium ulmi TaxID=179095 RepID=A0A7Y2M270_9MICO|nr:uncharacterized protein YeaO (DUF488 family) [Microbacterium ulmi]NNH05161.1 DUF488 family protein [Microbacterium ulmi]